MLFMIFEIKKTNATMNSGPPNEYADINIKFCQHSLMNKYVPCSSKPSGL